MDFNSSAIDLGHEAASAEGQGHEETGRQVPEEPPMVACKVKEVPFTLSFRCRRPRPGERPHVTVTVPITLALAEATLEVEDRGP